MKTKQFAAGFATFALLAPVAASAQVYYYAPNTTSGAFNYGSSLNSYIPEAAMPYVELGQQMQQQYEGYSEPSYYSEPSEYQYQSQSQSQTSYPSYEYGYSEPSSEYSYGYEPSSEYSDGYGSEYNQYGEYASEPESYSYPSGTTGPFGTQMCYWSDYSGYAPCGTDPQQWIQDPYTGGWY